jgi:N-acetylneuraminate lyase
MFRGEGMLKAKTPSRAFALGGLIAAPHTPMTVDGQINLPVIAEQAKVLLRGGVAGAFICGTTGEGLSMSLDERMAVAQRWVEVAGGRLKVIVHLGHTSQRDACTLAQHAKKIGASAISTLPPFYFKPETVEQLVTFCQPIAEAADDLPFYYYHIPSLSNVRLPMVEFLTLAAERIPTLHGIKYTHPDLMEYQRCLYACGGAYEIAWGVDEMLLGAIACGAKSAVGSTYNYSAPLYRRMIAAFNAGDLAAARECSRISVELIAQLIKYGGMRTGKAIMSLIGVDCGPTRTPLAPLTGDELAKVRAVYERLGFFGTCNTADNIDTTRPAVATIAAS